MRLHRTIDRRRFVKEGILLGCAALLFPWWKKERAAKPSGTARPVKARHYHRLAG